MGNVCAGLAPRRTFPPRAALEGSNPGGSPMIKLAVLAALGYAGYRYFQSSRSAPQVRLAGGPLSPYATLQHDADEPPTIDPYRA
jgi:hypothetical protein